MLWLERKYLSLVMSSLDMAKWVMKTHSTTDVLTVVIHKKTNTKVVDITL